MKKLLIYLFFILISIKTQAQDIYLHSDKDTYFPGEIMWFKFYADKSSVGYVQLWNSSQTKTAETKVELNVSTNGGSMFIPQNIPTGNYQLVAFTLSTKGVPFSKKIRIINPFSEQETEVKTKPQPTVQVFPEGGHLVHNITSKVGFKCMDEFGNPIQTKVNILENGQSILQAEANSNGLGYFEISPKKGSNYEIAYTHKNEQIKSSFPNALDSGLVLYVTDNGSNYIAKIESTKSEFYPLEVKFGEQTKKLTGNAKVEIPKSNLPEGTSLISVVDHQNQTLAERVVFRKPTQRLDFKATISTNSLTTRKVLNLKIDNKFKDASVAVRKLDQVQPLPQIDFVTYTFLQKDLGGNIHNIYQYFENPSANDLESLVLTHGWRRYGISSEMEDRYHILNIKYLDKNTLNPLVNEEVILSIPGKIAQLFSAKTNTEGVATFYVKNTYGNKQLATRLVNGKFSHIEILEAIAPQSATSAIDYNELAKLPLDDYAVQTQVENRYYAKDRAHFSNPIGIDSIPFYGKADVSYKLDDYTRFVVMEEVLKEYVKEVVVRKNKDQAYFRVIDKARNSYLNNEPLMLLDGIQIKSANDILNYNPLKVEKIDIIGSKFYFDRQIFDGIVNFSTYKHTLEDFSLDPSYNIFNYNGLQLEREFYVPPVQLSTRKPDHRNVLYWNPSLTSSPNLSIEILTSDVKGAYIIDLQGIDEGGKVGSEIIKFNVN